MTPTPPYALLVAALALTASTAACSTQFSPAPGPRLALVMDSGKLAFTRDGRTFEHGFLGGGLVDAVRGAPRAEAAAQTYHDRLTGGFVATLVGSACLVALPVVAIPEIDRPSTERSSNSGYLLGGAVLCGLGGLITGSILLGTAAPYQFDAVNLYNDEMDRRYTFPYPVPAGSGAPPPLLPPGAPTIVPTDGGPK